MTGRVDPFLKTVPPAQTFEQARSPDKAQPGNYLIRHWRGELSLGVSYWVNGALIANLLTTALIVAVQSLSKNEFLSLRWSAAASLIGISLALLAYVWSAVGIWRSAARHTQRGGRGFWASAARVMVVLGLLSTLGQLISANTLPQSVELAKIAFGADPLPRIQVSVAPNGQSILLRGTFGEGSAADVTRVMEATPAARIVQLNSNGGRIFEAKAIASEIRRRRLNTYVDGECDSACTLVFLAGRDRGATPNAKIGFHRASFAGKDTYGELNNELSDAYREAGVAPSFVERIQTIRSGSIWYPSQAELATGNVVTRVSTGGETATNFALEGIRSLQDLRSAFAKLPLFAAIDRRYPGSLDRVAEASWTVHERGGNDNELMSAARAVVSELIPRALATTTDDKLEEFLALMRAELGASFALGPAVCGQFLDGTLNVRAVLPPKIGEQDLKFTLGLFTEPPRSDVRLNRQQAANAMGVAATKLSQQQLVVVSKPDDFSGNPSLRCSALIAYFDAIAGLPPTQRRMALRGMYQAGS